MVKTITFDLHFTKTVIEPLTDRGREFLETVADTDHATPTNYAAAIEAGLHMTFETTSVRDWVTQFTKEESDGDASN